MSKTIKNVGWSKPAKTNGTELKFQVPFWVISDTHFFHRNIVEYEPSRRELPEGHNQYMVNQWQKYVQPHDTIVHLGDIALGSAVDFERIARSLTGRKFLLLGNHDRRSKTWYRNLGFQIIPEFRVKFGDWNIHFSHYPDDEGHWVSYPKHLNVHGHVHSQTRNDRRLINVSAEVREFRPWRITELIEERIKELEDK